MVNQNRLDQELVKRKLVTSREQAQRLILAGKVLVNGVPVLKPSVTISPEATIEITQPDKYVSRGGYKLEHALQRWQINVHEKWCIDIGASTGGFTDCLLQYGAAHVVAVDVGKGQLAWKLRTNPKVTIMEGVNARYLRPDMFNRLFDIATIDCSFISLRLILPAISTLLKPAAYVIALIKPQFEVGKKQASRFKGVIKDPAIHHQVLSGLKDFIEGQTDLIWKDYCQSPLLGPAGNKEFLAWLQKKDNLTKD